jgi:uncharacterized protein
VRGSLRMGDRTWKAVPGPGPASIPDMSATVEILRKPAPATLAELADRLAAPLRESGAERAVVFGSYARGEADGYSDLDLVVVLPTALPFLDRGRLLPELFDAVPVGIDLLIYTPEEYEEGRRRGFGIFAEMADHGVTIYPRRNGDEPG